MRAGEPAAEAEEAAVVPAGQGLPPASCVSITDDPQGPDGAPSGGATRGGQAPGSGPAGPAGSAWLLASALGPCSGGIVLRRHRLPHRSQLHPRILEMVRAAAGDSAASMAPGCNYHVAKADALAGKGTSVQAQALACNVQILSSASEPGFAKPAATGESSRTDRTPCSLRNVNSDVTLYS